MNQGPKLPNNAMIVTSDIVGAYQNIPQKDGLLSLHEALEERPCKDVLSSFMEATYRGSNGYSPSSLIC